MNPGLPDGLLRAKNPVTRITQARQNVTVAVELAVDGGRENLHIRVRGFSRVSPGLKLSA